MRVLLIYPLFPKSFWSFEKSLALINRKALLPPLGLITVAAILPQKWEFKLVDRNIRQLAESEWNWAELVIISGMIVQKEDLLAQIQEAKRRILLANVLQIILHKVLLIARVKISRYRSTNNFR